MGSGGGRSASPRLCSFIDSRWDWLGAVGLKMSPTPQTDPTEGNRSARSEPAVERDARPGMPVKSCQLARCLFVTQKKHPMHSIPCILPPGRHHVAVLVMVASRGLAG